MSQDFRFDPSRSLTTLEQDSTIIAVIEMRQTKRLVAAVVPGVEHQPLKKLDADKEALLKLLQNVGGMKRTGLDVRLSASSSLMRLAATASGSRAGYWGAMSRLTSSIPRALRCRANTGARRPIASIRNS
jgi:hypothetical protein